MNKRILNLFLVVAAVAVGVFLSIRPWQIYAEQKSLAEDKIQQMKLAEDNRVRLMESKVRLESPSGREEAARDYGYRKPGEQPIDQG